MQSVIIEIDEDSGFCFGVVNAIKKAEEELDTVGSLYCLGDIVHNSDEVERLSKKGLKIIDHDDLSKLTDTKVLLRAHGEPPATYKLALTNNVEIVDATCPVVLALQKRILKAWTENPSAQIVIYGKKGHAEVNGLVGQTQGEAIVVENENILNTAQIEGLTFENDEISYENYISKYSSIKSAKEEISFSYINLTVLIYSLSLGISLSSISFSSSISSPNKFICPSIAFFFLSRQRSTIIEKTAIN